MDSLDWLDLAAYALTRGGTLSAWTEPDPDALRQWRRENNPPWRSFLADPADLLDELRALPDRSPALGALRRAADTNLLSDDAGVALPATWRSATLMRWRLPLSTLQAAHAAGAGRDALIGVIPPRPAADEDLTTLLNGGGVADNHIHVGAAIPFDALLLLAMESFLRGGERHLASLQGSERDPERAFQDTDGELFDAAATLACATIMWGQLNRLPAGPDNEQLVQALADGTPWDFLGQPAARTIDPSARGAQRRYARPRDYFAEASLLPGDGGFVKHIASAKTQLLFECFQADADPRRVAALETYLRCEALLHGSVTQGRRRGLTEFLAASVRQGVLRRIATAHPPEGAGAGQPPSSKRNVVETGLRALAGGVRLRGVELRTSEQAQRGQPPVTQESLRVSLRGLLEGYIAAASSFSNGDPPVVTFPLCLIRSVAECHSPGTEVFRAATRVGTSRFACPRLWEVIDASASLLASEPDARRLFNGIDIAGDENALPSWCAAALFAHYRSLLSRRTVAPAGEDIPKLTYRVHAGEAYHSPLQGLRRVDEAVWRVVPPDATPRIGHALVLGDPTWRESGPGMADEPYDEALDDLVWAWDLLREAPGLAAGQLRETVASEIERAAALRYLVPADPQTHFAAYEERFKLDRLVTLGYLRVSSGNDDLLEPARELERTAGATTTAEINFQYLVDPALRAPVSKPLLDMSKMQDVYDLLLPVVRRRMKDRRAVVEACPTSNLVIAGLEGFDKHPLWKLTAEEIDVTLNTDDPGVFGISVRDEYAVLWHHAGAGRRQEQFTAWRKRGCELVDGRLDGPVAVQLAQRTYDRWTHAAS